ncbi:MAG: hypothetical protein ABIH68_07080 [bacterium]
MIDCNFAINIAAAGDVLRRRSREGLAPAILRAYCQTPRIDGSVRHHPPSYVFGHLI